MRERLAVECGSASTSTGRLAAVTIGEREPRRRRQPVAGRASLFRVPLAFGETCRILWREMMERELRDNGAKLRYIMIQRLRI